MPMQPLLCYAKQNSVVATCWDLRLTLSLTTCSGIKAFGWWLASKKEEPTEELGNILGLRHSKSSYFRGVCGTV